MPDVRITILEQSHRLGGKLHTGTLAGQRVELGADALLLRRPEAAGLAVAVGLDLVSVRTSQASLLVDGALRPLPTRTVLGIPADPTTLTDALSAATRARAVAEPDIVGSLVTSDVSVGHIVRARLGDELATRLVDPLLGGVYAGQADELSLAATIPGVAAGLRDQPSLVVAARRMLGGGGSGPVFGKPAGGLSELVTAVAASLRADIRLQTLVRGVEATETGWRLILGSVAHPQQLLADAVIVACPTAPASRLLRDVAPQTSVALAEIDYASVGLVTFVFPDTALPPGSGVLVPADAGYHTKAITFVSAKWPGYSGVTVVRASVGRYGQEEVLQRDDADLTELVRREVAAIVQRALPDPIDGTVTRWGGGLPQYRVGHSDVVRRAVGALPATITLAGAAYGGVGIPACIASGQQAVAQLISFWRS